MLIDSECSRDMLESAVNALISSSLYVSMNLKIQRLAGCYDITSASWRIDEVTRPAPSLGAMVGLNCRDTVSAAPCHENCMDEGLN